MKEDVHVCPFCWKDLRGPEIPVEYLLKGYYGSWTESDGPRFYSRLVGIENSSYDGVSEWLCPECGARWSRWTGKRLGENETAGRPR